MVLLLDLGNTNLYIGVYKDDNYIIFKKKQY